MNIKSLLITIVVAFISIWVMDFLIHGFILKETYQATASLWRPEPEMMAKMPFMLIGQFLAAVAFSMLFAACVAEKKCLSCSLKFSLMIGLLFIANNCAMYAVSLYPGSLFIKWSIASIVQFLVLGFIVHQVYRLPAK